MSAGRALLSLATLAALALTARAVFVEAVPLAVAVGALLGYLALLAFLALSPGLEAFAPALSRGDPARAVVALTFDDGPDPRTTPRVLRTLADAGVPATFFVLGERAARHPELIREIAARGHELAVHGWTHDRVQALRSPARIEADLERTAALLEALSGTRPRWFRPPVGQVSPRTAVAARRARLGIVAWSRRGYDGRPGARPDHVLRRLLRGLSAGDILLLHDAPERGDHEPAGVAILPALLGELVARGLRPVSLSDLEPGTPE